jgi:hypothetical protein
MHCPRCGHQQNSLESHFCTKCGLEISDVKELLAPELSETKAKKKNEINKANRQGMMMVFAGFALILVLAILRDFFTVPKSLFALTVLIFIIGGAIRMSFPSLFKRNGFIKKNKETLGKDLETNELSGEQFADKSLPEAEFRPPVDFGLKNYDTNELISPSSVTEHTTRKLKKEFQTEK